MATKRTTHRYYSTHSYWNAPIYQDHLRPVLRSTTTAFRHLRLIHNASSSPGWGNRRCPRVTKQNKHLIRPNTRPPLQQQVKETNIRPNEMAAFRLLVVAVFGQMVTEQAQGQNCGFLSLGCQVSVPLRSTKPYLEYVYCVGNLLPCYTALYTQCWGARQ